jgi:hypothetical protein
MQPPPGRRRTVLREIGVASVVMALFQSHFGSLKKDSGTIAGINSSWPISKWRMAQRPCD